MWPSPTTRTHRAPQGSSKVVTVYGMGRSWGCPGACGEHHALRPGLRCRLPGPRPSRVGIHRLEDPGRDGPAPALRLVLAVPGDALLEGGVLRHHVPFVPGGVDAPLRL